MHQRLKSNLRKRRCLKTANAVCIYHVLAELGLIENDRICVALYLQLPRTDATNLNNEEGSKSNERGKCVRITVGGRR